MIGRSSNGPAIIDRPDAQRPDAKADIRQSSAGPERNLGPVKAGGAQPFIPGLRLADEFHTEVVRPLPAETFPGLRYPAALIGVSRDEAERPR